MKVNANDFLNIAFHVSAAHSIVNLGLHRLQTNAKMCTH